MSTHRIRFVGPAGRAIAVATALAETDGVELTSSEPPDALEDGAVELVVTASGTRAAVEAAVAKINGDLPAGASIEIDGR